MLVRFINPEGGRDPGEDTGDGVRAADRERPVSVATVASSDGPVLVRMFQARSERQILVPFRSASQL